MRIFVTGATGYLGSAIADAFVRAGHHVTGLARNSEKAAELKLRGGVPLIGDLHNPASYEQAAAGSDVLVHAAEDSAHQAETDRLAIETLLSAARAGAAWRPRAVIYTSGVWVLGDTAAPAAEDAPLEPVPHVAWRPSHEQLVLSSAGDGLRPVVVRPGIVYGGSRGIIGDMFRDAANGLVRVIGGGDNHWPTVYDRDLGELYVRLATTPEASGLYHANDEGDETVNDIVDAIVAHLPTSTSVRRVPIKEAQAKLGPYALALVLDQVVRSPRARAIGWAPTLRSVAGNVPRLFEEWRAGAA
jgi:nucleoside-diphosphate-sugar epimerase